MPFCTRVFCREEPGPSISEVLLWLRQRGTPVTVVGGASRDDLLSPFWTEVVLAYDPDEPPLTVRCRRAGDAAGAAALREEVEDFLADLAELPDDEVRDAVAAHVRETRLLVVVEFPPEGVEQAGYAADGWLMSLFVTRADGLVQWDGVGFFEDGEVILPLA